MYPSRYSLTNLDGLKVDCEAQRDPTMIGSIQLDMSSLSSSTLDIQRSKFLRQIEVLRVAFSGATIYQCTAVLNVLICKIVK